MRAVIGIFKRQKLFDQGLRFFCAHALVTFYPVSYTHLEEPCEYELMYEVLHAEQCIRSGLMESPVMTEEMTVRSVEVLTGLHELWNPASL